MYTFVIVFQAGRLWLVDEQTDTRTVHAEMYTCMHSYEQA
jgi:hypothetical protein